MYVKRYTSFLSGSRNGKSDNQTYDLIVTSFPLLFNRLRKRKITVKEFNVNDATHLQLLNDMGIKIHKEPNGKIQLQHQSNEVRSVMFLPSGFIYNVTGDCLCDNYSNKIIFP